MSSRTLRSLLATALLVSVGSAAHAGIVVPNANEAVHGNSDNRFPLLTNGGMRYQQVFNASQFSSLSGPTGISEIDLRSGVLVNEAFSSTISNIQIVLSTTSKSAHGLSTTFASNTGADATTVYDGSLTISSTNADGPGNTKVFDIAIVFQTPFLYNPGAGNLLLDIKNISGANAAVGSEFFDAVNSTDSPISRVYSNEGAPNATSGTADSLGLIVQFDTAVPEPATVFSFAAGLPLGLGSWCWKRRRAVALSADRP